MLHSSTNSLFSLEGSKAIWLYGEQYLTTRYHQTSPLPHSASFLPKHNQLIRSTREMRLVCKALKATFGKSQRPIISGKPTGTPYCMGHRGMAKFPRGSTWPTWLILERVTNRFRQSRVPKYAYDHLSSLGKKQLDLVCYAAQSYLLQRRYMVHQYLLLTDYTLFHGSYRSTSAFIYPFTPIMHVVLWPLPKSKPL